MPAAAGNDTVVGSDTGDIILARLAEIPGSVEVIAVGPPDSPLPVTALLAEPARPVGEPRNIAELPAWAQRIILDLRDTRRRPVKTRAPRRESVSVA
jgi:hypothetical protein